MSQMWHFVIINISRSGYMTLAQGLLIESYIIIYYEQ